MNWIVMPVHNCLTLTQRCIPTLFRQTIPVRLFIANDGSTDGTAPYLNSLDTDVVQHTTADIGVTETWNRALHYLFSQGAPHVLVVNNDTEFLPEFYETLLKWDAPFVTGVSVNSRDKMRIIPPLAASPHPDFSAYLIRRECWERVGPFDESMKFYCQDGDYHLRMNHAGVRAVALNVPFYHERSATIKSASPEEQQAMQEQAQEDRAAFQRKWGCVMGTPEYTALYHNVPEVYNDVYIQGRVVRFGVRQCASRYEALLPLLRRFKRPFTMLDIGANSGYFSFRAASEFNCTAVAVDNYPLLPDYAAQNALSNVMVLHKTLSLNELQQLSACEHFDVVLALNVLHHFGEDAIRAAWAVLAMGDHIIIETPPPDDVGACNHRDAVGLYDTLQMLEPELLAKTPSHVSFASRPLWHFACTKSQLERPFFDFPEETWDMDRLSITSDWDTKTVHFADARGSRGWIPGINLHTFWRLNGVYPRRERVLQWVKDFPLPSEPHGDIRPWNFIIDGQRLHLIDGRDDKANFDDAEGKQETIRLLEQEA